MILLFVVIVLAILAAVLVRSLFLPILALGAIGYAVNSWTGSSSQPQAAASVVRQSSDQEAFCETIASADREYEPGRKAWYNATNPIVKNDIAPRLAAMRARRDAAVYAIVAGNQTGVQRWLLKVTDLSVSKEDHGSGTREYLKVSGDFLCPNTVTVKASVASNDDLKTFFRPISAGDRILVSGIFLPHDVAYHTPAEALDWDAFEGYAMASPTYRMDLSRVDAASQ